MISLVYFSFHIDIMHFMEKIVSRIIDVNFNRAREGARVVEEYARFYLNSRVLSSRAKHLRHRLSSAVSKLDQLELISSRDSLNDVGYKLEVDGQLKRKSLSDVFMAASKRLPEALRALSETLQAVEPGISAEIEALRFESYTLEKEILLAANGKLRYSRVRLYVLLDGSLGDRLEQVASECISGGADCLQLRAKNLADEEIYKQACRLVDVCKGSECLSIINDRADIALASKADGVHLGQDDMAVSAVREIAYRPLLIGLSTHNIDQLNKAIELSPDYVGLGPTFHSKTKDFDDFVGLDYLGRAVGLLDETSIGHTAIGGINAGNIKKVLARGVRCVAVCSAVTASEDPRLACRELKDEILAGCA